MTKRSFLLTVAAGLLASVAFATPSHAATQTVTTSVIFSAPAGTVSDFTITYTPAVDPITVAAVTPASFGPVLVDNPGPNSVTLNFAPVTSGSFVITFQTASTAPSFTFSSFSFSGSANVVSSTVSVTPNVIPEPTSMALLGIGMTGFLAFRRLFKRGSVALMS
jgi:hypothetical protein